MKENDEGSIIVPRNDINMVGAGKSQMGRMLLMAAMMGGTAAGQRIADIMDGKGDEPRPQPMRAEDDPRFNRLEKISPAEFFITVGPGELEGEYYAVVMAPKGKGDVSWVKDCPMCLEEERDCAIRSCEIHGPDYKIVAKCRYGFSTAREAMFDAARQYPSLPVLSGPEEYQYPFYDVQKMRILIHAQKRRDERAVKAQRNADRSKQGQYVKMTVERKVTTMTYVEFKVSDGTVTDSELNEAKLLEN